MTGVCKDLQVMKFSEFPDSPYCLSERDWLQSHCACFLEAQHPRARGHHSTEKSISVARGCGPDPCRIAAYYVHVLDIALSY